MGQSTSASVPYDASGNQLWGDQRLKVGQEAAILVEPFDGAAVNTIVWTQSQSGMTQTVAAGICTLNAASSLVSGNYSILNSVKSIRCLSSWGLHLQTRARFITQPNAVLEVGWGTVATTGAPTNGCFIRVPSSGVMQAVLNYGGSETVTQIAAAGTFGTTTYYTVDIFMFHDRVQFRVSSADGTFDATTTIVLATGSDSETTVSTQSAFARVYNSGTVVTTAAQLFLGDFTVAQMDSGPIVNETSSVTSVASSASNVTLLAANPNRTGGYFFNDSNKVLYLKFGVTASTTSYTVQIDAGAYYELPTNSNGRCWAGQIDGIWASANGNARITEVM